MKNKLILITIVFYIGLQSPSILSSEKKWYQPNAEQSWFEYLKTKAKNLFHIGAPIAAIKPIISLVGKNITKKSSFMGVLLLTNGLLLISFMEINNYLLQHSLTNEQAIIKIKEMISKILDDKMAYPTLNIKLEALAYGNEFSYWHSTTEQQAPFNPVNECVRKACNQLYKDIEEKRKNRSSDSEESIQEEKIDRFRILLKNYLLKKDANTINKKIDELEKATINLSYYTNITQQLFEDEKVKSLLTNKLTDLLEKNVSLSSKANETEINFEKKQATKNIPAMIKNMRIIPFYMKDEDTDIAYADVRTIGLAYTSELLRLRAKLAIEQQLKDLILGKSTSSFFIQQKQKESELSERKKEFNPEIWKPLSQEEQEAITKRKQMSEEEWELYQQQK